MNYNTKQMELFLKNIVSRRYLNYRNSIGVQPSFVGLLEQRGGRYFYSLVVVFITPEDWAEVQYGTTELTERILNICHSYGIRNTHIQVYVNGWMGIVNSLQYIVHSNGKTEGAIP